MHTSVTVTLGAADLAPRRTVTPPHDDGTRQVIIADTAHVAAYTYCTAADARRIAEDWLDLAAVLAEEEADDARIAAAATWGPR